MLVTPQFHHWHHSATTYNKNYAVHLPIIDKMFGSYHLPVGEWPDEYGIEGNPVPDGYLAQLVHPIMPSVTSAERDDKAPGSR